MIAGSKSPVPETPAQKKIKSETGYFVQKRIEKAKELQSSVAKYLPDVQKFIQAAQQKDELKFPASKLHLLKALESIRDVLDDVEEMVHENDDKEPTEPDSEAEGDADRTIVKTPDKDVKVMYA
ncbi:hypothetical protein DFH06DRAFT_1316441 [Mycena polygramma]|nr:hypothetical protein DFH06DRAFT_1347414 [Mycena polygramma]KAJ7633618.1 hypothetical protein DFH06DRAFT_1337111 [Mycena polygramma]KAJ7679536.1 hypothetical protein DFH06DRAFT_1316441 [Mycena polygramma]